MANLSNLTHPSLSDASLTALEGEGRELALGRIAGAVPIAIIDIGSNSVRLVVYERLGRAPTLLFNEKALCGLGRGVSSSGRLGDEAVELALASIRRFAALNRQMGVGRVDVLATAAVRDAENGPAFVSEVEEITGTTATVLDGREEARIAALGIISGIRNADGICGDLGGGSLELIEVSGTEVGSGETYPLGGLALDDASGGDRGKAEKIASKALNNSSVLSRGKRRPFYAIGGTWRSLARLHIQQTGYPLRVMHNYSIEADEALDFCRTIIKKDVDALDSIEAISKSRRQLLPMGAVVLAEIITSMKPSKIVMSAIGLREGHLYDLLDIGQQAEDPLLVAAEEFSMLRSRSPRHSMELAEWTGSVFEALKVDEAAEEVRLRRAGCMLADIGWRAHPEYRGLQSLNMIANASLIGIDHPGRAFLALTVYYRHEGVGAEEASTELREIASSRFVERARLLGATIRLAHMISAAMPGVVQQTQLEVRDDVLTLVLPSHLAALEGDRVMRRLRHLAKLRSLDSAIVVED